MSIKGTGASALVVYRNGNGSLNVLILNQKSMLRTVIVVKKLVLLMSLMSHKTFYLLRVWLL